MNGTEMLKSIAAVGVLRALHKLTFMQGTTSFGGQQLRHGLESLGIILSGATIEGMFGDGFHMTTTEFIEAMIFANLMRLSGKPASWIADRIHSRFGPNGNNGNTNNNPGNTPPGNGNQQ